MADRMGVYPLEAFKNMTKPTKGLSLIGKMKKIGSGRGAQMMVIDWALGEWEVAHTQNDKYPKVKSLMHIVVACAWWLKLKQGKSSTVTTSRAKMVRTLMEQAQKALQKVDQAGAQFTNQRSYAIQQGLVTGKKSEQGKLEFTNSKGVSLHGNYKYERQTYEMMGKQFAVSATGMHQPLKINGKSLDTATFEDFCTVFRNLDGNTRDNTTVDYFKRSERLEYLVMIQGELLLNSKNEPLKTSTNIFGKPLRRHADMWAMDVYGNLFVSHAGGRDNGKWFNHSSFTAGTEVLCAGMIVINDGRLAFISNNSGHYQPNRLALQNALVILNGVLDLNNVRVDVVVDNDHRDIYRAQTFLATPNAQPDWNPQWNGRYNLTDDM